MRLLPFAVEGFLIFTAFFFMTGIPLIGLLTLTVSAVLASVLINNRYAARELENYLKEEIENRTGELRESENRYRTLVANIPGAAFRCRNNDSFTALFLSSGIEDMTGYPSGDLVEDKRKSFISLLHPDTPDSACDIVMDALNRDKSFQIEFRIVDRKDNIHWLLAKGTGVRNAKGEVEFIDGVLIDITEEKLLAMEKEKWEQQNRQARKLESIGRLAGGVAHDLNNLLTPILGYAELASPQVRGSGETEEYIDEIIGAARMARDLIQQLLTFSRGHKLPFEELDLNGLTESFSGLLRKAIREDISITYRMWPERLLIKGIGSQLEQVLLNLAINAQDAMPDGGEIIVTTGKEDGKVILMVSDTGSGIDRETEELMFEPFFSTKGSQGTGLGLATVYGIIQHHKGAIRVMPNGPKGTVFRMEFAPA